MVFVMMWTRVSASLMLSACAMELAPKTSMRTVYVMMWTRA